MQIQKQSHTRKSGRCQQTALWLPLTCQLCFRSSAVVGYCTPPMEGPSPTVSIPRSGLFFYGHVSTVQMKKTLLHGIVTLCNLR